MIGFHSCEKTPAYLDHAGIWNWPTPLLMKEAKDNLSSSWRLRQRKIHRKCFSSFAAWSGWANWQRTNQDYLTDYASMHPIGAGAFVKPSQPGCNWPVIRT